MQPSIRYPHSLHVNVPRGVHDQGSQISQDRLHRPHCPLKTPQESQQLTESQHEMKDPMVREDLFLPKHWDSERRGSSTALRSAGEVATRECPHSCPLATSSSVIVATRARKSLCSSPPKDRQGLLYLFAPGKRPCAG